MKSILKSAVKAAVVVTGIWAAKKYGVDKKIKDKFEQIKNDKGFANQED